MTVVAPTPTTEPSEATHDGRKEMLEDYSLRYAPTTYRKWSSFAVANTALGGIAYLADFAIGGSLVVTFGFTNALFAILLAATVIFLTSFPIAYYSAKYSIDMDLITRGAGFGYFGGSVTSLIYASFTFIFFALEGSIMAQGLHLGIGLAAVARLRGERVDDPAAGDLRHDAAVEDADVDAAAVARRHVPAVHRDRDRRAGDVRAVDALRRRRQRRRSRSSRSARAPASRSR